MADPIIPAATIEQWATALETLAAQMRAFLVVTPPPPSPTLDVSISPITITAGSSATLSWAATNALSVVLDGVSVKLNDSISVSPTASRTYLFAATGPGGTVAKSVDITVTAVPPPPPTDFQGVTFDQLQSAAINSLYVGGYDPVTGKVTQDFKIEHNPDGTFPAYPLPQPNIWRVKDGLWSDSTVWNLGRVPQDGDNVAVNHFQFMNNATPQTLRVKTIAHNTGALFNIGTKPSPSSLGVKKRISYLAGDYEPMDPLKFTRGFLSTGILTIYADKQPTPQLDAVGVIKAGDAVVSLVSAPMDWAPGDLLCFPDQRRLVSKNSGSQFSGLPYEDGWVSHTETRTIKAITGSQITLDSPLDYDHEVQKDELGTGYVYPPVMHLTRDIEFVSESPGQHHFMMGHTCKPMLVGLACVEMGVTTAAPIDATNIKARYPIHFHHCHADSLPVLKFCSVYSMVPMNQRKWAYVLHNTHYAVIEDCVGFNYSGWIFGEEDGSELKNQWTRCVGSTCMTYGMQWPAYGDNRGFADLGWNGFVFWFRGNGQIVRNCSAYDGLGGFNCWVKALSPTVSTPEGTITPYLRGLDWDGVRMGGGRMYRGCEVWYLGLLNGTALPDPTAAEAFIKNAVAYACSDKIYYNYVTNKMRFIDWMQINGRHGVDGTDYAFHDWVVDGMKSYAVDDPILPSTVGESQVVKNSFFTGANTVLGMSNRWGCLGGEKHPKRVVTYDNCTTRNCKQTLDRNGIGSLGGGAVNLRAIDRLIVRNFEGVVGDDFEVFIPEQAPDYVMPMDVAQNVALIGSPDAGTATPEWQAKYDAMHLPYVIKPGLTNQQLKDKYNYCWSGQLLPSGTITRNKVAGLVGPIQPMPVAATPEVELQGLVWGNGLPPLEEDIRGPMPIIGIDY